ncbi:MAG TPA: YdcF family protein, partial [Gemmatimonadaceae bacterium]
AADAIVVLSAGITTDGTLHPQATDRLLKGLELFSHGVAPALVLTREDRTFNGTRVTSQADQARIASLVTSGNGRIVYAGTTRSTREEAVRVRDIARRSGWRRLVVVTSPFHSRRACAVFEKVGFAVACLPADSRDLPVSRIITPKDRLRAFQLWIYEVAGDIRYRQRGWL